ncbi:MAG: ABC transporter permease subunit [Kiritimatiellia bacterium]|jgi:microcin C transport system permease protein
MPKYFLRRLLLVVPTFLGITIVCFALTQFVPGGPVEQRLLQMRGLMGAEGAAGATAVATDGAVSLTETMRQDLMRHYGFDLPIHVRYKRWLVDNRLGLAMKSYQYTDKTAWQLIASRIPVSLVFGLAGFFLSYLVCIPLGIAKALRHGTRFDFASSAVIFIGYAIPAFALGMLLKMLLCGTVDSLWDVFPLGGVASDGADFLSPWGRFADRVWHMALPVACYVAGNFAVLTLLMKNSLLDQLSADYVRTVLAKGATRRRAVWGHALRNSLIPIATGFGGILTVMFAGSVIIEKVFEIPGMGLLSLETLHTRDYPVFMAILSLTSILGLLGQVLSDFCYVLIDPRIRFTR